jgi:hypothetical protein
MFQRRDFPSYLWLYSTSKTNSNYSFIVLSLKFTSYSLFQNSTSKYHMSNLLFHRYIIRCITQGKLLVTTNQSMFHTKFLHDSAHSNRILTDYDRCEIFVDLLEYYFSQDLFDLGLVIIEILTTKFTEIVKSL